MRYFLFLVFIVGCHAKPTDQCCREVPEEVKINFAVIGEGGPHEYKGVRFYVTWSGWKDKDNIKVFILDEVVADDKLATVAKRNDKRDKMAKIEGITSVKVINRQEYVLTVSREVWENNKNAVFDILLE